MTLPWQEERSCPSRRRGRPEEEGSYYRWLGELITALPAVLSLGTCTRARVLSLPGRLVSRQHAIGVGALGATLSGYDPVRASLAGAVYPDEAGNTRFGSFPDVSVEDYEYTIRNELGITRHCTQAAWPHLISRRGGAVLMCGSIAGVNGSRDLLRAAHVAAKGAVMP